MTGRVHLRAQSRARKPRGSSVWLFMWHCGQLWINFVVGGLIEQFFRHFFIWILFRKVTGSHRNHLQVRYVQNRIKSFLPARFGLVSGPVWTRKGRFFHRISRVLQKRGTRLRQARRAHVVRRWSRIWIAKRTRDSLSVGRLARRKRSKLLFLNFERVGAEAIDVVAHDAVASFVAD